MCSQFHPALCNIMDCMPSRLLCPWDFPGKNIGMGCHSLLQGNFPNQGSNPGSPTLKTDSLLSKPPGKLFIGIQLLYNVVLVSAAQQNEPVTWIHIPTPFWTSYHMLQQSHYWSVSPFMIDCLQSRFQELETQCTRKGSSSGPPGQDRWISQKALPTSSPEDLSEMQMLRPHPNPLPQKLWGWAHSCLFQQSLPSR